MIALKRDETSTILVFNDDRNLEDFLKEECEEEGCEFVNVDEAIETLEYQSLYLDAVVYSGDIIYTNEHGDIIYDVYEFLNEAYTPVTYGDETLYLDRDRYTVHNADDLLCDLFAYTVEVVDENAG